MRIDEPARTPGVIPYGLIAAVFVPATAAYLVVPARGARAFALRTLRAGA